MVISRNFILLFVSTLGITTLLTSQPKFYIAGGTEIDLGNIPNYAPVKRTLTIRNTGAEPLVFLCCCAPPYSHEDTILEMRAESCELRVDS